jgi:hypothetical protein
VDRSVGRSVGGSLGWLVGCSVGWLVGCSVGWSVAPSDGRLVSWLVGRLAPKTKQPKHKKPSTRQQVVGVEDVAVLGLALWLVRLCLSVSANQVLGGLSTGVLGEGFCCVSAVVPG